MVRPASGRARCGVRSLLPPVRRAAGGSGNNPASSPIGHSHALDLILTGRGVSGEEALRMGVANRLVEPGHALDAAVELATELARLPQNCLRSDR